ncbi:MAG: O-antigen ligase family protein, partial [Bacteroidota bacterium]
MGSQWLYIVGIDFLVTFFILARKNDYQQASSAIFGNIFSKLYLAFFVLAGISTFTAINQTESWVCYVRLIATIIAFLNISILLYGRTGLFKILAQLLGLILLVESIQAISQFFNGIADTDLSGLILSLKGTTGNKNIFAASTVVKIPFVIYCIYTFKLWGRILNIVILVLASLTIFIVNARASFLSIIFITLLYIVYCILGYLKDKKVDQTLYRISYVIIPILAAAFISQIVLTNVKNLQEAKGGYGTVTDRLASAASFNAEDNQVRIRLWTHALDYTRHHPLMGCGYGNW